MTQTFFWAVAPHQLVKNHSVKNQLVKTLLGQKSLGQKPIEQYILDTNAWKQLF